MTIDQAIDRLSAAIDVRLQQRLDDTAARLIAAGSDPNRPPAPPDPDADWQPIGFDDVLRLQREIDAKWKVAALAQIRHWLAAHAET